MTCIITSAAISTLILLSEAVQTVLDGDDGGDSCVKKRQHSTLWCTTIY